MPRLQYVCLSDLHFGEDDSLLSDLPIASAETGFAHWTRVLAELVNCLTFVVRECGPTAEEQQSGAPKPTLILNGDTIEFALCPLHKALMAFQLFLKPIIAADIFSRVVVIPGNHDHHLWVLARETQYARYLSALKPGQRIEQPWYTSNLFVEHDPLPSALLNQIARKSGCTDDAFLQVAYPNYGVLDKDGRKCVIFSHGHFIEPAYHLMTALRTRLFPERAKPTIIWDIEAENGPWIDFFWSSFGNGRQLADSAEDFYEKCKDLGEAIRMFANLFHGKGGSDWLSNVKYAAVDTLVATVVAPLVTYKWLSERWSDLRVVLGDSAEIGLREYVTAPLKNQILHEKHERPVLGIHGFPDLTFAFGHTHKPFTKDKTYDEEFSGPVHVYNTGGWVVDTLEPDPYRGAAMLLLDENLDAATVRLYNETDDKRKYRVHVGKTPSASGKPSPFFQRVYDAVHATAADGTQPPWDDFADAVVEGLRERRKILVRRIKGGGACTADSPDMPEIP